MNDIQLKLIEIYNDFSWIYTTSFPNKINEAIKLNNSIIKKRIWYTNQIIIKF